MAEAPVLSRLLFALGIDGPAPVMNQTQKKNMKLLNALGIETAAREKPAYTVSASGSWIPPFPNIVGESPKQIKALELSET